MTNSRVKIADGRWKMEDEERGVVGLFFARFHQSCKRPPCLLASLPCCDMNIFGAGPLTFVPISELVNGNT